MSKDAKQTKKDLSLVLNTVMSIIESQDKKEVKIIRSTGHDHNKSGSGKHRKRLKALTAMRKAGVDVHQSTPLPNLAKKDQIFNKCNADFVNKKIYLDHAAAIIHYLKEEPNDWNERQRSYLIYFANACIARMQFNETIYNFYATSSLQDIQQHLNDITKHEHTVEYVEWFKNFQLPLMQNDFQLYCDLILLIKNNLKSKELFDVIHEFCLSESTNIRADEDKLERVIKEPSLVSAPRVKMFYYLNSEEYKSGREALHIQEIMKLSQRYCTKRYLEFYKNHELRMVNREGGEAGLFFYIEKPGYYDDLKHKVEQTFKKIGDYEKIDGKIVDEIRSIIKVLRLKLNASFIANYKIRFFEIYDLCCKVQQLTNDLKNKKQALETPKPSILAAESSVPVPSSSAIEKSVEKADVQEDDYVPSYNILSTPEEIKNIVRKSLDHYATLAEEEFSKIESTEKSSVGKRDTDVSHFGNRQIKLLMQILFCDKPEIQSQLFKKNVPPSITFQNIFNLTRALGGDIINQEGSRYRPILNGILCDIDKASFASLPSLHGHHGGDLCNDKITRITLRLFRDFFIRAGVLQTYGPQIKAFMAKKGKCLTIEDSDTLKTREDNPAPIIFSVSHSQTSQGKEISAASKETSCIQKKKDTKRDT